MRLNLSTIGAVLKKDWLTLWPVVVLNLFGMGTLFLLSEGVLYQLPERIRPFANFAPFVGIFSVCALCFGVAHQDPAPGVGQDWVIRPLGRLDLVSAKLLFLLATLIAPMILFGVVASLAGGNGLGEALLTVIFDWSILFLIPVALAIASLTSNVVQAMAVVVGAAAALIIGTSMSTFLMEGMLRGSISTGFQWVSGVLGSVLLIVVSFGILYLAYGQRRILTARIAGAAGVGLAILVSMYLPVDAALAVQRVVDADPAPQEVVLSDRPVCVSVQKIVAASPEPGVTRFDPTLTNFALTGAPAGWSVVVDRMEVLPRQAYFNSFAQRTYQPEISPGRHLIPVSVLAGADGRTLKAPVKVRMVLSLLSPEPAFDIPLSVDRRKIDDKGWCNVRPQRSPTAQARLSCKFINVAHFRTTLDGAPLDCEMCQANAYTRLGPEMSTAQWALPTSFKGTVVRVHPHRYRTTVVKEVTITSADLAAPNAPCGPLGQPSLGAIIAETQAAMRSSAVKVP